MAFEDDIGPALAKAYEFDSDNNGTIYLARATNIVCRRKLNPLLGSQKAVKEILCHPLC